MDEYDGDHEDIIRIFQSLAVSPNIKICLSSRPWNIFVEAFDYRKLLLQELTKGDIELYVKDVLEEDQRFRELQEKDDSCNDLVEEIVDKAQGVFLWVFLVVRSLLRGLTDGNEIVDLQRRLRHLPADLESYFRHMFDTIEDVYKEQTARVFLVCTEALNPPSVLTSLFLDNERADPDYALKANVHVVDEDELRAIRKKTWKHLNACCKDLLEVNINSRITGFTKYQVTFLHRTVVDFLKTKDMSNMLKTRAGEGFRADLSLCRSLLAQFKAWPFLCEFQGIVRETGYHGETDSFNWMVKGFMFHASELEIQTGRAEVALIDEFDRTICVHASKMKSHWTNYEYKSFEGYGEGGQKTFLALAIQENLHLYVTEKLVSQPDTLVRKCGRPLLDYTLRRSFHSYSSERFRGAVNPDMVRLLLDHGADPNQEVSTVDGRTVWDLFLGECYSHYTAVSTDDMESRGSVFQIMRMMILQGADPNLKCKVRKRSTTFALSVSEILDIIVKNKVDRDELEALLVEKRRPSMWKWLKGSRFGFLTN